MLLVAAGPEKEINYPTLANFAQGWGTLPASRKSEGESREEVVPKELGWTDSEDIGILLSEKFPEQNPLEVRFTDLHKMVLELPDFKGDAASSNEAKLEAIQMAWYEEWQENQ